MVNPVNYQIVTFSAMFLFMVSCNPYAGQDNEIEEEPEKTEVYIDYESADLLAKFDTEKLNLPQPTSYREEIHKAEDHSEEINYSALDSMFEAGTDVNEIFVDKSSSSGGIDLRFSLKDGFSNSSTYSSTSIYESNAMDMALDLYYIKRTERCFDLVHFLLSRGFNVNVGGIEALYRYLRSSSKGYFANEERVHAVIELFQYYGFDMKTLDLSASDSNEELLEYLISQGSINYNMNTFSFETELQKVYDQKDALIEKGVVFNFADIDGETFSNSGDTTYLLMMLEMGLSPYHKTPKGKDLRSDFSAYSTKGLKDVIDKYRLDHPN